MDLFLCNIKAAAKKPIINITARDTPIAIPTVVFSEFRLDWVAEDVFVTFKFGDTEAVVDEFGTLTFDEVVELMGSAEVIVFLFVTFKLGDTETVVVEFCALTLDEEVEFICTAEITSLLFVTFKLGSRDTEVVVLEFGALTLDEVVEVLVTAEFILFPVSIFVVEDRVVVLALLLFVVEVVVVAEH